MSETPAGWYDDGTGGKRYWDGARWTDNAVPESASEPAQPHDPATTPATAPASRGSGGKLLLGGVLGVVLAGLVVGVLVLTGLVSVGESEPTVAQEERISDTSEETDDDSASQDENGSDAAEEVANRSGNLESDGFDTPEEAAIAYVEALRDQDVTAMRDAFAVESYVAECDYGAHLERIGMHVWFGVRQFSCPFPGADPIGQQANLEMRNGAVAEYVVTPLARFVSPQLSESPSGVMLQDAAAVREFQDEVAAGFSDYIFAGIANVQTVAPTDIVDTYDSETSRAFVEGVGETHGLLGSDYEEVVVTFDLDGAEWVFAPSAGRYNDRWYLVTPQSTLAQLLGFEASYGGIGPLEY